ncbi:MAG: phosphoheptose isomerase, partial [Gemmatimonadetes bacterium]
MSARWAAERLAERGALLQACVEALAGPVAELAAETLDTLRAGGRLFFAGNGGSAADAQ